MHLLFSSIYSQVLNRHTGMLSFFVLKIHVVQALYILQVMFNNNLSEITTTFLEFFLFLQGLVTLKIIHQLFFQKR